MDTNGGATTIIGEVLRSNTGFDQSTLDALNAKFDAKDIKTLKDVYGTGKVLSYVEGHRVIDRLNTAFKGGWSFKIVSKEIVANTIIVQGMLQVGNISKEQFGAQKITFGPPILKSVEEKTDPEAPKKRGRKKKVLIDNPIPINLGYDMKSAVTDCIKKCASLFGVALYLYGEDETS